MTLGMVSVEMVTVFTGRACGATGSSGEEHAHRETHRIAAVRVRAITYLSIECCSCEGVIGITH